MTIVGYDEVYKTVRRVWGYQKGQSEYVYIEEEQTIQWQKKVQKDEQRSTKHTNKTKDRVTRTPLKTGVNKIVDSGCIYEWKLTRYYIGNGRTILPCNESPNALYNKLLLIRATIVLYVWTLLLEVVYP